MTARGPRQMDKGELLRSGRNVFKARRRWGREGPLHFISWRKAPISGIRKGKGAAAMTVTLNLNPEVEKCLMARAHARGVSLNEYLQELVAKEAGFPLGIEPCPNHKRLGNLSDLPYSSILLLPELISIWSARKTIRARLIVHERFPDGYKSSIRVESPGRPLWSPQNRPFVDGSKPANGVHPGLSCFTLPDPVQASPT
jgi:hypothetical protein